MVKTYVRPPPMFVKGEGCYLWDVENRKYLDFTAGIAVNALGHCDPEMSKIIAQQVQISLTPNPANTDSIMSGENLNPHL
jgi:acetylornithine aminotransferase